jgi:hypothetical protein
MVREFLSAQRGFHPFGRSAPGAQSMKFPISSGGSGKPGRGEGFAADCQHSHLVASFLALSRPSPNRTEKARKCATKWLWLCGRRVERRSLSATTCDFSRFSLQASFWGHTSRLCRWSSDRTTITARDNVNYHLDTSGAAEVTSPAAAETSQIDPSLSFQVGGLRER